jgi:regulator of protease activity HflC (stomatin/prohibitin superfamily)
MPQIPYSEAFLPVVLAIVGVAMVAWLVLSRRQVLVVYDWHWALLFQRGKFVRLLKPGLYRFFQPPTTWIVFDKRLQTISVPGQEVLTKDALGIKLTLHVEYQIEDPVRLVRTMPASTNQEAVAAIYPLIQLPIREAVAEHTLDEILQNRDMLPERVTIAVTARLADTGIKLVRVAVRDIMVPASLREAFAAPTVAQKQGAATLERARAEVAAMRALGNAARMAQDQPALLQLRALQAVQGGEGKNTLVLDLSGRGKPNGATLGDADKAD